jgi:hypothetical protein
VEEPSTASRTDIQVAMIGADFAPQFVQIVKMF